MAIFVPEVAAPYLMKEIDKRLVISNAALDISLLNCLLFYIIIFADILCRGSRFYNDYKTSN